MHDIFVDRYAEGTSLIHQLDPRGKLLGLMALIVAQVITDPYHVWTFIFYGLVLMGLLVLSRIPWRYTLIRLAFILPFVLLVAIFLPFFHRDPGGTQSG